MFNEKKPTTATVTIEVTPAQKELLDHLTGSEAVEVYRNLKTSFELSTFNVHADLYDPYASSNLYDLLDKIAPTLPHVPI